MIPMVLYIRTKNDKNGKPRFLFVILDPNEGYIRDVIEEPHGLSAVEEKYPRYARGPIIDVAPAQYHSFRLAMFK